MSTRRELKLLCIECGHPLYTDELFHTHAWCLNEKCKLYIKRLPPFDLCFSKAGDSFMPYIKKSQQKEDGENQE